MLENYEHTFKFIASNSAQKAQFCKRSWNRQCRNRHNGDDLADFWPITIKKLFHYGNFTIWLCHSGPKLFWNLTKFGNIGPIMPIVSWWVFRLLTEVGYWTELETANLMLPNVYDHCAVTAARTLVIFHITTDKYTGFITNWKNCVNFTFPYFVPSESK